MKPIAIAILCLSALCLVQIHEVNAVEQHKAAGFYLDGKLFERSQSIGAFNETLEAAELTDSDNDEELFAISDVGHFFTNTFDQIMVRAENFTDWGSLLGIYLWI